MLVRKTDPVPIECVARGYLSGSGWKEYQQTGAVCGIALPSGLRESDRLPEPIFTPATKAESGHDVNISEEEAGRLVGADLVARLKTLTLEIYSRGVAHAESKGIIIADTKFEFGLAPASSASRHSAEARGGGGCRARPGDRPHRRSAHAGLVALLAARTSTSPATASPASTSSTCATTSKRSSGTSSRRCHRCQTRSSGGRVRSTSKRSGCCRAASFSSGGRARSAREPRTVMLDRACATTTPGGNSKKCSSRERSSGPMAASATPRSCSACTATP